MGLEPVFQRLKRFGWDEGWSRRFETYSKDGLLPARVAFQSRGIHRILTGGGEMDAEVAGLLLYQAHSGGLPVTGDWVAVRQYAADQLAIIHHVLPRRTVFSRKAAGRKMEEQIIAANVDVLFVVMALDQDFNLRRLERYMTAAGASGARVVIVLNKADTQIDPVRMVDEARACCAGHDVVWCSALRDDMETLLADHLREGTTAAFVGSSGVGKSTIVNKLSGCDVQATRAARASDGKGRHTTTARELFLLPNGAILLDTPGMRELQLWSDSGDVEDAFPEIAVLGSRCRFRDCSHSVEEDCAVRTALESGELDEQRWQSFVKLQKEARYIERQADVRLRLDDKQRWKKLSKEAQQKGRRKR